MEIKEEHKALLKVLGLKEADFDLFDDKFVRYEYDADRGVRIFDPFYTTSYREYIDVDGWSAWSSENDTFMSDILKDAQKEMLRRESLSPKPDEDEISEALQRKFKRKNEPR